MYTVFSIRDEYYFVHNFTKCKSIIHIRQAESSVKYCSDKVLILEKVAISVALPLAADQPDI